MDSFNKVRIYMLFGSETLNDNEISVYIILYHHEKKSTINVASVIRKCLARLNYEFP